jgi:hypothetical protein
MAQILHNSGMIAPEAAAMTHNKAGNWEPLLRSVRFFALNAQCGPVILSMSAPWEVLVSHCCAGCGMIGASGSLEQVKEGFTCMW